LFYISAAFGFGLYAAGSIFYGFTGSIFSPSVALALWLSGVIGPVRLVCECNVRMTGDSRGICGFVCSVHVHSLESLAVRHVDAVVQSH
jgi:glycerol uptake facilitator-like aquaporin